MAWKPSNYPSSEGKMIRTPDGNAVFFNGAFYLQYSASTAIANTTDETSIFTGENPVYLGDPPQTQYPGSTRVLPRGCLTRGTMFGFKFYGSIANTGTPNLQLRLGLVGPYPATTFNAIADTTAVAMTTTSGTVYFAIVGGFNVQADSETAGILNGWIGYEYLAAGTKVDSPVLNTTSFNTRQQYSLDIRATWSAASASNTLSVVYGAIEVVG